jgi:hypothetical protein
MLNGMHADIHGAVPKSGSEQDQRLTNAFGPNWGDHHDQLKQDVDAMRKAKVKVGHNNGDQSDELKAHNPGDKFVAHVDRKGVAETDPGVLWLGSKWHDENYGRANRAGTMLHEISHAVVGTGDNAWDKDGKVEYIDKEGSNKKLDEFGLDDHRKYHKNGAGCTSPKADLVSHRFSNSFVIFRFRQWHGPTAQWKRP